MKRIFSVIVISLLLGGCGMHRHAMPAYKHFLATSPDAISKDAKEVYVMESLLDIDIENSDSLAGGISWETVIGGGKLKEEVVAYTTAVTAADLMARCKKRALTIFTSKEDIQGAWSYTKDHQGTYVMNHLGELAPVKSQIWSIKPEKDFSEKWLTRLDLEKSYLMKLRTDSQDWRELAVNLAGVRFKELATVTKDGKEYLSVKSPKELEEIINNDALLSSLLYWAVDGLYGFVAVPVVFNNPITIPLSAGVVKMVTLVPSLNEHGINQPGFGGFKLDAYYGSVLTRRFYGEYGACLEELRKTK